MKRVRVIPVPAGMTPEEAWDEIRVMGRVVEHRWWHRWTRRCRWAVIEIEEEAPDV